MFIDTDVSRSGAPAERHGTRGTSRSSGAGTFPVRAFYKHLVPTGRNLYRFITGLGWNRIAQLSVVLLTAVALKYFYSTANVNQLRWSPGPHDHRGRIYHRPAFSF